MDNGGEILKIHRGQFFMGHPLYIVIEMIRIK